MIRETSEEMILSIECDDQEEIDHYSERLSQDGERKDRAAGSKIDSGCPGRSCRPTCWVCGDRRLGDAAGHAQPLKLLHRLGRTSREDLERSRGGA